MGQLLQCRDHTPNPISLWFSSTTKPRDGTKGEEDCICFPLCSQEHLPCTLSLPLFPHPPSFDCCPTESCSSHSPPAPSQRRELVAHPFQSQGTGKQSLTKPNLHWKGALLPQEGEADPVALPLNHPSLSSS